MRFLEKVKLFFKFEKKNNNITKVSSKSSVAAGFVGCSNVNGCSSNINVVEK